MAITREQWDVMTAQQQFDYVRLLEDTVDEYQARDVEHEHVPDEFNSRPASAASQE